LAPRKFPKGQPYASFHGTFVVLLRPMLAASKAAFIIHYGVSQYDLWTAFNKVKAYRMRNMTTIC